MKETEEWSRKRGKRRAEREGSREKKERSRERGKRGVKREREEGS